MADDILGLQEFADASNYSHWRIRAFVKAGKIKGTQQGPRGKWSFKKEELERFLTAEKNDGEPADQTNSTASEDSEESPKKTTVEKKTADDSEDVDSSKTVDKPAEKSADKPAEKPDKKVAEKSSPFSMGAALGRLFKN